MYLRSTTRPGGSAGSSIIDRLWYGTEYLHAGCPGQAQGPQGKMKKHLAGPLRCILTCHSPLCCMQGRGWESLGRPGGRAAVRVSRPFCKSSCIAACGSYLNAYRNVKPDQTAHSPFESPYGALAAPPRRCCERSWPGLARHSRPRLTSTASQDPDATEPRPDVAAMGAVKGSIGGLSAECLLMVTLSFSKLRAGADCARTEWAVAEPCVAALASSHLPWYGSREPLSGEGDLDRCRLHPISEPCGGRQWAVGRFVSCPTTALSGKPRGRTGI